MGPYMIPLLFSELFSALHEGCLTLPLWVEMTYNNCKFPCNLNNLPGPFHCLLFRKCKKWIRGLVLLFVFTHPFDTRLPTTFRNTNHQLFSSNATILGQRGVSVPFERCNENTFLNVYCNLVAKRPLCARLWVESVDPVY